MRTLLYRIRRGSSIWRKSISAGTVPKSSPALGPRAFKEDVNGSISWGSDGNFSGFPPCLFAKFLKAGEESDRKFSETFTGDFAKYFLIACE
ncbi:hypothetical protein NPIL_67601 [Nephila pilipes]|uniref:Uncharacterized protein n=1 Tax=Nephila pilipes TaxID=299642 RepID=A0A8X6NP92_NEPPI|nr:hypothetical protein NPIL_67601 [Nephila pilipes]